ncbi:hypothetical protein GJ744_007962 [Endocarpon pusillum]|uniref:Mitochondrial division protein 1 n=1 Tax=Endocarpon pusillum TaxID=364733 RepID=A0A8H7E4Z4_9EURO|nr:hypothetical protein GJ744_007962 [Endocarpon pusillum]
MNDKYKELALHQIPKPIVKEDISTFLEHELAMIQDDYNKTVTLNRQLPADWPGLTNVQSLVRMAIPLFIFAITICRFIKDRKLGQLKDQLNTVLKYETRSQASQLDAMYRPVLDQLLNGVTPLQKRGLVEEFQQVIGSIVVLASPLSATALDRLLGVPKGIVESRIDLLHSVLSIPFCPDHPIRLLHLSFRDFLVDAEKRETNPFWVNKLYSAALIFAPKESIIRNTFQNYISNWISQQPNIDLTWNAILQTLEGHSSTVQSVAFSHDLKLLASASYDRTVRIWDAATGTLQQTLEGHGDWIQFVAFSHDSKLLASASHDKTVRIWDVATGTLQQTLEGHGGPVQSVAFSHDSKLLASASLDTMMRIWDAATGTLQQTLEGHGSTVQSVAFSHDSKLLASASYDTTMRIWDAATGTLQQTLTVDNYVSTLSFDITNMILITNIGCFKVNGSQIPSLSISSQEADGKSSREGLGISWSWVTWKA